MILVILFIVGAFLFLCIYLALKAHNESNTESKEATLDLKELESLITVRVSCEGSLKPRFTESWTPPNVNHLPRFEKYEIKGKNPTTNRFKTVKIETINIPLSEEEISKKSGLLPPFTTEPCDRRPTERQLAYANDLLINVPPDCTIEDVSCLISRRNGEFSGGLMSREFMFLAAENDLYFSPYLDAFVGASILLRNLPINEKLCFYAYLVYCALNGVKAIKTPQSCNKETSFLKFSADNSGDQATIDAINELNDERIAYLFDRKTIDRRNKKQSYIFDLARKYIG